MKTEKQTKVDEPSSTASFKQDSPVKMAGKLVKGVDVSLPPRIKYLIDRLDTAYDLNKMLSEKHEERIVNNAGTVKTFGEFQYQDGGTVPVGESYHIHYSRIAKSEIYMTGNKHDETSLLINRLKGDTIFGQYVKLKEPPKGMDYLNRHKFEITKKHRKIGHARRYFAQQGNNLTSPVFEISRVDYNKATPFYKKTQMKWSLDINKQLMINKNIDEINRIISEGFKSLEFSLNPSMGYIDGDESPKEEKLKKLQNLLPLRRWKSPKKFKKSMMVKSMKDELGKGKFPPESTDTSSNGGPPSSNGGGGPY